MAVFFISSAGLCRLSGGRSSPARCAALLLQIFQNLSRRIRSRPASQARSGMRARTAQIQISNRRAVSCPIEERAHGKKLIEGKFAVENVSASQAVSIFQILRCDDLVREDQLWKIWRVLLQS